MASDPIERGFDALLAALAGASLASLLVHPTVGIACALAVACGAAFAWLPSRAAAPTDRRALRLMLAALAFFVPMLTHSAPPGADITMHAAMGRSIALGEARLSPAYGDYLTQAYPRGLSVLIGCLAGPLGMLGATWIVATTAYVVWVFALRAFARDVLRARHPEVIAVVASFASRQVQDFFSWGGSPNALALGLGVAAAAAASRAAQEGAARREGPFAALLLAAAVCIHPMGSVAAAILFGVVCLIELARAQERRSVIARALPGALLAGAVVVGCTLWFKVRGPTVSPDEALWVHEFGAHNANVVHGPWWMFPIGYVVAITKGCGGVWLVVSILSAAFVAVRAPEARRELWTTAALLFVFGLLVAWGYRLPGVGLLFYGARLMPLVSLLLTVPFARALDHADALGRARWPLGAGLAIAGAAVHYAAYQRPTSVTTRDDVALMACVEREVPADAVIEGLYGDGTLWIPALTGRAVTYPHVHVTLFDEFFQAVGRREPRFRYVGATWKYKVPGLRFPYPAPLPKGDEPPAPPPPAPPSSKPLCASGAAALYRL